MRAVRIIAIQKPTGGVRLIGIGEITRRILTKVLAWDIKEDIKLATGTTQCSGLTGACEASISAMDKEYQEVKSILIIDAKMPLTICPDPKLLKPHKSFSQADTSHIGTFINTQLMHTTTEEPSP